MKSQSHLSVLDGVRAITVLWIMLFHFHSYSTYLFHISSTTFHILQYAPPFSIIVLGYLGVEVLFVLSGFFCMRELLSYCSHGANFKSILNLVVKRLKRLYPLLISALLIATFLIPWERPFCSTPKAWLFKLLFLNNFLNPLDDTCIVQTWSLAIDFQMHIVLIVLFGVVVKSCKTLLLKSDSNKNTIAEFTCKVLAFACVVGVHSTVLFGVWSFFNDSNEFLNDFTLVNGFFGWHLDSIKTTIAHLEAPPLSFFTPNNNTTIPWTMNDNFLIQQNEHLQKLLVRFYRPTQVRAAGFFVGSLLAIKLHDAGRLVSLNITLHVAVLLIAAAIGVLMGGLSHVQWYLAVHGVYPITSIVIGLTLYWILKEEKSSIINRFLSNMFFRFVAKVSYASYLIHMFTLVVFVALLKGRIDETQSALFIWRQLTLYIVPMMVVFLIAVLTISSCLHWFIEKPAQEVLEHIQSKLKDK